jgi:hypothetical protein
VADQDHLVADQDHLVADQDHLVADQDHLVADQDHLVGGCPKPQTFERNYFSDYSRVTTSPRTIDAPVPSPRTPIDTRAPDAGAASHVASAPPSTDARI